MTWQATNNGQYTVKSGYHYQRSLISELEGEASRKHSEKDVWKRLWKMKVAPAVKFFVWRACSDALPISARDVWSQGCIKVQKMSHHNNMFFNVWTLLVQQLDQAELEEVAVTLKGIWTRRNEFLHGKGFKHPTSITQIARNEVSSFHEENQSQLPEQLQRSQREVKWQKPEAGYYKLTGMRH
ncbi:uncharacterized protein LOC122312613 [Carya illinoinensis]|uniref:uncharacterized protein LOC122312613 n=1 Tax=Carya illinoinensis TaxID=32201 RepID=UPI001C72905D|nr:uncharacterized protein LOC122312613 [Carya illinoinensis]